MKIKNINDKFIKLNKLIFKKNINSDSKKYIYIEFNKWPCNHIAISNCILALKKSFNYKVVAYLENGFQNFLYSQKIVNSLKFFFGSILGIKNFGIYKSFMTEEFLKIKGSTSISLEANIIVKKLQKKIKNKSDILNIKIKNILIGDLIYDSFLKEYKKETINLKDNNFVFFFKKSVEYFLFWYKEFEKKKIKAIVSSQSVYLSSLPVRIGIYKNCICLVANPERLYRLSKENQYSDKEFILFDKIKKKINVNLYNRGLRIADKRLNLRFNGKIGLDLSYLSKTAYGKVFKKRVLERNKKFKILIAPHSFSDAPHQLGTHLFSDYYDWLNFICENANGEKFNWYIKCHPNFVEYFDDTINIIKRLVNKYKFIKYINPNISHRQLIKEGIGAVVTCHGTIGSEYPYFNIPVINASKSNPHFNYNFNFNPKSLIELKNLLKNIDKNKININKKEILEYYFFKNIYFLNNWLFRDFEGLISFVKGYKNIYREECYEYWINNWDLKKQNKITDGIRNFIKSKNYMMTFENYKLTLEQHLNENFFDRHKFLMRKNIKNI